MAGPPDWLKVGGKLICVHADRHFLRKGKVYTVHEIWPTSHPLASDCLVNLEEVMRELQLFGLWRFHRYTPGTGQEKP